MEVMDMVRPRREGRNAYAGDSLERSTELCWLEVGVETRLTQVSLGGTGGCSPWAWPVSCTSCVFFGRVDKRNLDAMESVADMTGERE